MITISKACLNLVVVVSLMVFSISSVLAQPILSLDSLIFVYIGPDDGVRPLGPHTIVFYRINATQKVLERVWSLGAQAPGFDVRHYWREHLFVATSDEIAPKIYTVFLDSITVPDVISFADNTSVRKWRLTENSSGEKSFIVPVKTYDSTGAITTQQEWISVADNQRRTLTPSSQAVGEVRLSGPSTPYYAQTTDIVPIRLRSDGEFEAIMETMHMSASRIPDDLIKMKSSYGWNLILNEPDFRVFVSIPWTNGLTEREILIYNRVTEIWQSVMIPGASTVPNLNNGWLAGVIADPHPLTDYKARRGGESVKREEIVVVNIQTGEQFTLHLGKRCKVLWIDNSEIYYATGKELYHAKIVDQQLVDPRLLIDDGKVWSINWAFPGTLKQ